MSEVTLHETRGWGEVELGGKVRTLRFRAHEIALLEERLNVPVTRWFPNEETGEKGVLGMRFVQNAILVGVAHEFAALRRQRGAKERLSPKLVAEWLDGCDFGTILVGVTELVAMGLPGAAALVAEEEERAAAEREAAKKDDPLDSESGSETTRTEEPSTPSETPGPEPDTTGQS